MKQAVYIFTFFSIYFCNGQVSNLIKKEDIIIFSFNSTNVRLVVRNTIYSENNRIITSWIWSPEYMGQGYFEKCTKFVQNKDTMIINYYGQGQNLYIKNLPFKKGIYEIQKRDKNKKVLGSEIKELKKIQNRLFKNSYVPNETSVFKDVYFRNLQFNEIDLADNINLKLKPIDL